MKQWGKKVYVARRRLQLRPDHRQVGRALRASSAAASVRRPTSSRSTSPTSARPSPRSRRPSPTSSCAALVGGAHMSFFRQWAASGMNKKIPLSSTTFGVGNEHLALSPAEGDGILIAGNYSQEETTPANKDFLARWAKRFGDTKIVHEIAVVAVPGHQAVGRGGQEGRLARPREGDRRRSRPASPSKGPAGTITIDPPTHHAALDIKVMQVKGQKMKIKKASSSARRATPRRRATWRRTRTRTSSTRSRSEAELGDDASGPPVDYAAVVILEILYMIAFLALISAGLAVDVRHDAGDQSRPRRIRDARRLRHDLLPTAPASTSISPCWCSRRWSSASIGLPRRAPASCAGSTAGMIDTMLATWGLSLLMVGLVTLIFGNTAVSVPRRSRRIRSAPIRSTATISSSSPIAIL